MREGRNELLKEKLLNSHDEEYKVEEEKNKKEDFNEGIKNNKLVNRNSK
jgi:hypothetical protein